MIQTSVPLHYNCLDRKQSFAALAAKKNESFLLRRFRVRYELDLHWDKLLAGNSHSLALTLSLSYSDFIYYQTNCQRPK